MTKRIVRFGTPMKSYEDLDGKLRIKGYEAQVNLCFPGVRKYFSIPKDAKDIRMIVSTKKENDESMKMDLDIRFDHWFPDLFWFDIKCSLDGRFRPSLMTYNKDAIQLLIDNGFKYVYFDYKV